MLSSKSRCFNLITIAFFAITVSNCADYNSSRSVVVDKNPTSLVISEESNETDQAKAVRVAEEFIKINGYTDVPADEGNITHEAVEFADNLKELLEQRKNTLNAKAYGVSDFGKTSKKGWTVVFKHSNYDFASRMSYREKRFYQNAGRAVTMDQDFKNLMLQHKEFPLNNARKKL